MNYAERHRAGLRVGTAITEGTANFLVNCRMNKSQQMRWSRRGADLLLQVRCAVYNGTLGFDVGQRSFTQRTTYSRQPRLPLDPQFRSGPPISGQTRQGSAAASFLAVEQHPPRRDELEQDIVISEICSQHHQPELLRL